MFKAKKLLEKIAGWRNRIKPGPLMRNLPAFLYALRLFQAWKEVIRRCRISKKHLSELEQEDSQEGKENSLFGVDCVENDEFKKAYKKIRRNYIFRCWKRATVKVRFLANIAQASQKAEQNQLRAKALSVASQIKDIANQDRISRLVCRRYLDRIIHQITIVRQVNFRRCFDQLKDHRLRCESVCTNKMASVLRGLFAGDQTLAKKSAFDRIQAHALYGPELRLRHVMFFAKKRCLKRYLGEWRSHAAFQARVRNESVLERLLFNKMCLTFGLDSKKNAFDHRLREKCLAEDSYRYKGRAFRASLDSMYAEGLRQKTFRAFAKLLQVRRILARRLDCRNLALRKLRDLVGIDPVDFAEVSKNDILQLKASFGECLKEEKTLQV